VVTSTRTTDLVRRAGLALALLGACVGAAFGAGRFQEEEVDRGTQVFSLNTSRECEALADRALEALELGRLATVFATFGRLLTDHSTEVLPARFAGESPGHYPHHQGVEAWIEARLDALDAKSRDAWEEWCTERAAPIVRYAALTRDSDALLEAARLFPRTSHAVRAWLAVGDLRSTEGRIDRARAAWEAARRAAGDRPDAPLVDALERRERALLEIEAARSGAIDAEGGEPNTARSAESSDDEPLELPRGPLHSWTVELPDGPFASSWPASAPYALFATTRGDRLFVNTSLEVLCLDLMGGDELWRTERPDGWDLVPRREVEDYFRAIDYPAVRVSSTLVGDVVVSPLQLPISSQADFTYQTIQVTSRIPERRLFAHDARTGELLWSHAPGNGVAPSIDGLSVAAPPTEADGLLLVPLARVEGRIELRVACIDPADGSVIWSTRVVSGQRALNMFNRHEEEFSCAPLTVHDSQVLVCSQLGSVANLDLETGAVKWQATYEPIPLPITSGMWRRTERRRVWRNVPPVVADGLVLATPTDSSDLLALDLATGRVEWSRDQRRLSPRRGSDGSLLRLDVDSLLGVRDGQLLLGGALLAGWTELGGAGLLEESGLGVALPRDLVPQAGAYGQGPHTRLFRDRILVPSETRLFVHDLSGARREDEEFDWDRDASGNVTVAQGAVVALRGDRVTAFLDLELLEAHTLARLERDPSDLRALETFGRLLLRRANVARAAGDADSALANHERLRTALDPQVDASAELRALYAEAVLVESALLASTGRLERAAELLARAADAVRTPADALAPLVALARLRRAMGDPVALEAALRAVDTRSPFIFVPARELASDPAWTAWLEGADPEPVEARLWVAVQRAFAAEGPSGDATGAVAAWQSCLERFGPFALARGTDVAEASQRSIARWLAVDPTSYAPFEAAAADELEAIRADGDLARLDSLLRRYPFASASRAALALGLDLALDSGDLALALARGRDAAALDGSAPTDAARVVVWSDERLVRLALLADASGNGSLARVVLDDLERRDPQWRATSDPVRGLSAAQIRQVLRTRPITVDGVQADRPTFGDQIRLEQSITGAFEVIGRLHAAAGEEDGDELLIHRRDRLERLPLADGGSSRRVGFETGAPFPSSRQHALAPEALVWLRSGRIYAADIDTGRERWSWPPAERTSSDAFVLAQELGAREGVAVATVYRVGLPSAVVALELLTGETLWEIDLPPGRWLRPLIDGGRVTLVSEGIEGASRVVCLDLVTGSGRVDFDLDTALYSRDRSQLRVIDGRLVVPLFEQGALSAWDVRLGERAWRRDLAVNGSSATLGAVIEYGETLFALAYPTDLTSGGGGSLFEIEPRLGGARVIEKLDPDEAVIGVGYREWIELDAPFLFTLWHDGVSSDARLSAIALPLGRRWKQRLRLTNDYLTDVSRTLPVVSDEFVAIVWGSSDVEHASNRSPGNVSLRIGFFRLENGTKEVHRMLPNDFGDFENIDLIGYRDTLWLICNDLDDESSERIEVWK
jgi:outer membrane protein assembly factor BamB/tetratricopeptide (TPR) repeat protein